MALMVVVVCRPVEADTGKASWWSNRLDCIEKDKTAILKGTATVIGRFRADQCFDTLV